MKELSHCTFIFLIILLLTVQNISGQCLSERGRSKLMPLGNHLIGLQKTQDSIQLAILATEYLCLDKGDQSNIEFSDGSFLYLANMLELNCDGKAYFNLTQSDVHQLTTKSIAKVVLGSKYEGYTKTSIPTLVESKDFVKLMNCVAVSSADKPIIIQNNNDTSVITSTTVVPSSVIVSKNVPAPDIGSSETNTSYEVQAPIPTLRSVQFIATSGGKTFSELSYLGSVVSEQVGDKNVFRYRIQGNFTDADIQHVIASLAIHGYKGAFEVK